MASKSKEEEDLAGRINIEYLSARLGYDIFCRLHEYVRPSTRKELGEIMGQEANRWSQLIAAAYFDDKLKDLPPRLANKNWINDMYSNVQDNLKSIRCVNKSPGDIKTVCPTTLNLHADNQTKEIRCAVKNILPESSILNEGSMCCICMDKKREVAFDPCGHIVCCTTCVNYIKLCPLCRSAYRKTLRVFF